MVDGAKPSAHFRLIVLDGKAYVEKFRKSIQTRDLFTLWGFQQLFRRYPGRVPDLELMFDCNDRPVIKKNRFRGPDPRPPPLFKYCSDRGSLDIVSPDWSFWGWPETNQKPWEITLKELKEGNKRVKWMDRLPYAYWKGNPDVSPIRVDLKKCNVNYTSNVDWNTRLFFQNPITLHSSKVVNTTGAPVSKQWAYHAEKPEKFNGQNFKDGGNRRWASIITT
ncbi:O-glucosyltransferase Rumi [Tanacetum coccineum]